MRRPAALAAALLLAVLSTGAGAHAPAKLVVTSPAEGARVVGSTVRVVVEGEGGSAPAAFKLDLDGRLVDATGRVGGVFTTLTVSPGGRLVLDVPVEPGAHTLTFTPNFDPDAEQETVVRRFTAEAEQPGSPAMVVALAGIAVAGALGTAFVVRRKAAAG